MIDRSVVERLNASSEVVLSGRTSYGTGCTDLRCTVVAVYPLDEDDDPAGIKVWTEELIDGDNKAWFFFKDIVMLRIAEEPSPCSTEKETMP